jgi:hypothetical protein
MEVLIISILIFTVLVKERKICRFKTAESETEIPVSVFKDKIFWIFLFVCFITAVLFSSIHYYRSITTKIWINGVSKWPFIPERIADFLSGNAIVSFTEKNQLR